MQQNEQDEQQQPPITMQPRKSTLLKPGFMTRNKITNVLCLQQYLICEAPQDRKLIIYDIKAHTYMTIKVHANQFITGKIFPHLFGCGIGQYLYLWEKQAFRGSMNIHNKRMEKLDGKDQNKQKQDKINFMISKTKISRMKIKTFVQANDKGVFIAGKNLSTIPGKKQTSRRSIYYIEDFDYKKSTKPLFEIDLPKSKQEVNSLKIYGIYLLCSMFSSIFMINLQKAEILIAFSIQIKDIQFLRGNYQTNFKNFIGINKFSRQIVKGDIQEIPIYGIQMQETHIRALSCCICPSTNRVYATDGKDIFQLDPIKKNRVKVLYSKQQNRQQIISEIFPSSNNQLIIIKQGINTNSVNLSETSDLDSEAKSEEVCYEKTNNAGKYYEVQIFQI